MEVSLKDVKTFWEEHPLLSYELSNCDVGSEEFFRKYDSIRRKAEEFALDFLELKKLYGKILDVGCGNGWLLEQYAKTGNKVVGIDLTKAGVELALMRFRMRNKKGLFCIANAEELPFKSNTFDLITSLGVIHHTPRTEDCAKEIIRCTRKKGEIKVAVYYKNIFLRKRVFPLFRIILYFVGLKLRASLNYQIFINSFDGPENPLGKVYSKKEAKALLLPLETDAEVHYFPARFIPSLKRINLPKFILKYFDCYFGFLIYLKGIK